MLNIIWLLILLLSSSPPEVNEVVFDMSSVVFESKDEMDTYQINNVVEESSVESWVKIRFTDEEYDMMCRMVEAEATGGSVQSKQNVANVIINRVMSDEFPDTVEGVIFQRNAFSPIYDGRYYEVNVTESTLEAVYRANRGIDTTNGSTFFMVRAHSDSDNVTWFDNNLEFVMKDGIGHEFWRTN